MFATIFHLLGMDGMNRFDTFVACGIALAIAVIGGILLDLALGRLSFGAAGNSMLILASSVAGLCLFAARVAPLRLLDMTQAMGLAAASAAAGFIVMGMIRRIAPSRI